MQASISLCKLINETPIIFGMNAGQPMVLIFTPPLSAHLARSAHSTSSLLSLISPLKGEAACMKLIVLGNQLQEVVRDYMRV